MISIISCDTALPVSVEEQSRIIQKSDLYKWLPFTCHIYLIVILYAFPLETLSLSLFSSQMVLKVLF